MPQSLDIVNLESYQDKYTQKLLTFAEKANLYKRFMVGSKQDKLEDLHTILLQKKLCPENCEVMDFIISKIKGEGTDKIIPEGSVTYYVKETSNKENPYIFDWNELEW